MLRTSGGKLITAHTARVTDFFAWINERHRIYLNRTAGKPKPWTRDPILQRYKFTNVFRQLDRGTVWLTQHIISPHYDDPDQSLLLFNLVQYRMYNWIPTGEFLGYLTKWDAERVRVGLQARQDAGIQVFTGAHIVRGENGIPKITSHCQTLSTIWQDRRRIYDRVREGGTLQAAFECFLTYRMIGDFLAYEFVTDLRNTQILGDAPDVMTWASAGPGAQRGLLRLFPDLRTREDFLGAMRGLLRESQRPGVLGEHVPPLELRDIEHSLCEFDKYWRCKFDEGRPRSTYPGVADLYRQRTFFDR